MSPNILRMLWGVVERSSGQLRQLSEQLDDEGLEQWLIERMREMSPLDGRQQRDLHHYIQDRLPLIREVALN
ncbi:MAG: hypothetical protein ACUVSQ_08000 [Pseudanabaenaceae cyanobacterium]